MLLDDMDQTQLLAAEAELNAAFERHCKANASLDLTRGKPSIEQLELSAALDGILQGDYTAADGSDTRGYGGLDGLPEAKRLMAEWLGVRRTRY